MDADTVSVAAAALLAVGFAAYDLQVPSVELPQRRVADPAGGVPAQPRGGLPAVRARVCPAPFEVQSEELEGGVNAFSVRGELDLSTAPQLEPPAGTGELVEGRRRDDRPLGVRVHRLDRDRGDRQGLAARSTAGRATAARVASSSAASPTRCSASSRSPGSKPRSRSTTTATRLSPSYAAELGVAWRSGRLRARGRGRPRRGRIAVGQVPDPGDRHVADAERAAAGVDPPPDQQRAPSLLDHLGVISSSSQTAFDVAQVIAQPLRADVGGARPISSAVPTGKNPMPSSQTATISSMSRWLKASKRRSTSSRSRIAAPARTRRAGRDRRSIATSSSSSPPVNRSAPSSRCTARPGCGPGQLRRAAAPRRSARPRPGLGDPVGDDDQLLAGLDHGVSSPSPRRRKRRAPGRRGRLGDRVAVDQQRRRVPGNRQPHRLAPGLR